MRKVVFLRVAHESLGNHQTALVLQKAADGFFSIQGHASVAWSDRQRCWDLFRKAAKSSLGLCEASVVSVCLSEPPYTAISDLAAVFRQPSHIVSLTLSPLPDVPTEQESERRKCSRVPARNCSWQPFSASSGLYEQRSSPLPSPQANRRAKLSGREMNKLLWQLDEVSQSLERTQTQCEAIARRCGEGRARERSEGTDGADDDYRVERLLQVAENLTTQIIHRRQRSRSPTPEGGMATSRQPIASSEMEAWLPDSPTAVCAQPNLSGGMYVLWNPVRLDGGDRNNGCKVSGYAVYVDGVQRSQVDDPIRSHTEIAGLENRVQYQIQVSTLAEDGCQSPLSPSVPYSHEAHTTSSPPPPTPTTITTHRDQQARHSAKVENWLLHSSQTSCDASTPTNTLREEHTSPHRFTECQDGGIVKSEQSLTTPSGSTHLPDDARSVGSSHTSGIVMDHPPSSPKLTPSCPSYRCDDFSLQSETTTLIVDPRSFSNKESSCSPYHHLHFSPSPSPSLPTSRAHSPISTPDHTVDTVIDEPLEFTPSPPLERVKKSSIASVQLVAGKRHRGPASPDNVFVRHRQPGYVIVSWTPARRDAKGCSNGCFVLGYRVYINGTAQISVDGPMSHEATIRCPHPNSNHKLMVQVRTRSIAAESAPSSTAVYDMLLQEQYSGPKVTSAITSTATLVPSSKPHPQATHKSSPIHNHTAAVGLETFV